MISASLSLSLPRLGWKSTSTPRSLKICTAAGESASEMRTLGFVIGYGSFENELSSRPKRRLVRKAGTHTPGGGYGSRVGAAKGRFCPGRRLGKLGGLGERGLGLGKGPVDPLRQQRNVFRVHGGAAPDPQARGRIAVMREIVAGAFLLHERHELLGEIGLRVGRQRSDRGIDHLHADRGVGSNSGILGQEVDPRRLRLPVG